MIARVTEEFIEKAADTFLLDPNLVSSFVGIESSWNPCVMRYEKNWPYFNSPEIHAKRLGISIATETELQKCSFGLMQVMGGTARDLGFQDHLGALLYAEIGIDIGCKDLIRILKKHGMTTDAVSAYNAGTPGRDDAGLYVNQGYVNRFLFEWTHRGGRVQGISLLPSN